MIIVLTLSKNTYTYNDPKSALQAIWIEMRLNGNVGCDLRAMLLNLQNLRLRCGCVAVPVN